eukprot:m.53748 g.53748  ORF g.53748 m.53748 type:complete len:328 (-) comp15458_c1_seq2:342-1325(-)
MNLDECLQSVRGFAEAWFSHGNAVQQIWFGARKKKFRTQIVELVGMYFPAVETLNKIVTDKCESCKDECIVKIFDGWTLYDIAMASIFIDQMGRNHAAISESTGISVQALDKVALNLALYVYNQYKNPVVSAAEDAPSAGSTPTNPSVKDTATEDWSAAKFCFFSLIFRHTRDSEYVHMSLAMLNAVLTTICNAAEILPPSHDLNVTNGYASVTPPQLPTALVGVLDVVDDAGLELLQRFAAETVATMETARVSQYKERALAHDVPCHRRRRRCRRPTWWLPARIRHANGRVSKCIPNGRRSRTACCAHGASSGASHACCSATRRHR